ncbi:hypothetical protein BDV27DRAFT_132526 [Aspergillus caelatus]|uniref:Uncharacterized protein n=1 Tax=Aspergillus caelatus TaxID=61420 RepID=A0A5N6ZZR2_9EURO|nr:uncharacterized protein BDV27DRAFT_132526 [Aspergillus caelatus]KAE8361780.1 hypothetical protein BDV27DRAFT_132526 [Aspergillus caelatus]
MGTSISRQSMTINCLSVSISDDEMFLFSFFWLISVLAVGRIHRTAQSLDIHSTSPFHFDLRGSRKQFNRNEQINRKQRYPWNVGLA